LATSRAPRQPPRSEPVGSLLRPPALKELFDQAYSQHESHVARFLDEKERATLETLQRVADDEIRRVVQRQVDLGLDVITDGELRRAHFVNSLFDAVEGIAESPIRDYFTGDDKIAPPSDPLAVQRLRIVSNPLVDEYRYTRTITDHPCKVTIPAASNFYQLQYPIDAYGSREAFVAHMAELTRTLVQDAVQAGVRYVQFDYPLYPTLSDPERSAELVDGLGVDWDTLLANAIAADNATLEGLPEDVTAAVHICRGNYRSRWWAKGSLEPVAERMFNELGFGRFLIEWEDTTREGDYSPLRHVPSDGPIIVMGLVNTKVPAVESEDDILDRLDHAARYLDIDRLALSPQCGFASVWHGNELDEDAQWRKLEVVVDVADRVWGSS
jgi:5-methyltetrahydropteroyltriglutamate--homocysteine methyltransferase